MAHPSVQLGDRTFTIPPFSSFKFIEITEAATRITRAYGEAVGGMDDFIRAYMTQHTNRITRAEAELRWPDAKDITQEAWEASGGHLDQVERPGDGDLFVRFAPAVFKAARPEVERLVCLLVIPNSELADADEAGDDLSFDGDLLKRYRRIVLHEASIGQTLNAFGAAFEAIKAESEVIGDGPLGQLIERVKSALEHRMQAAMVPAPETEPSSDEPTSSSDSPTSSPDGPAATSSTKSRGRNSSRSASKPASVS